MATGANISEVFSISDARTGIGRVSRLVLSGWGADPSASAGIKAFSDQGRLWGTFTQSSGALDLYKESTLATKVATGTVSSGKVTLEQANSSGISGSADVDNGTPGTNPTEDFTFDVVVTYDCDENDVAAEMGKVQSLLDSGAWEGQGTRLEFLLGKAKQEVDRRVVVAYKTLIENDADLRYMLAHLVNIGDLRRMQALVAARHALLKNAPFMDTAELEALLAINAAETETEWKLFAPTFDYERDLQPDARPFAGVVRLGRS